MPPGGIAVLEEAGLEVDHLPDRGSGSLADVIAPYAGVIVRSPHQVDAATLAAGERLEVVGRAGVGTDNIDVDAATRHGVLVMNLPWGNTVTAAEHTIALLLAVARNVPQASRSLSEGRWERAAHLGVELKDKSLGVVGLGRIGREVARRALAFDMEVLGHDPALTPATAADIGVELLELGELLERADFVTLHVPLTESTRGLVDGAALARMKPGARLVNCARGGVVDEAALLEALESGRLAGAAADVFEEEPTGNRELLSHPRFVGTPHIGGATVEARQRVGEGIARQVADYLGEGIIRHALNVQALPPEQQRMMLPYVDLGRRLGALLAQCFEGIEAVRVVYSGDITAYTLRPVTTHVLLGLLQPRLGDSINPVNAAARARETGLDFTEETAEEVGGYANLLRVEARTPEGERRVAGTVFEREDARVVEFEGLPIELSPRGHLLVLVNDDRPGVVGEVGRFLGGREVNIADLRLGRSGPGGEALAVYTLDEPLAARDLDELRRLDAIRWARMITL